MFKVEDKWHFFALLGYLYLRRKGCFFVCFYRGIGFVSVQHMVLLFLRHRMGRSGEEETTASNLSPWVPLSCTEQRAVVQILILISAALPHHSYLPLPIPNNHDKPSFDTAWDFYIIILLCSNSLPSHFLTCAEAPCIVNCFIV